MNSLVDRGAVSRSRGGDVGGSAAAFERAHYHSTLL